MKQYKIDQELPEIFNCQGIYVISNIETGKFYIGSSHCVKTRISILTLLEKISIIQDICNIHGTKIAL